MFKDIWIYLIGLGGVIVSIITALLAGKAIGKAGAEKKQAIQDLKGAKKANEIDDDVRGLSDAELDARLHKHQNSE